jgi:tetratricopeptide (TPR) repeat protein
MAAYRGNMLDKAVELFGKSVENGYKGETALFYKAAVLKKQDKDAEYKATLEEGAAKFPGDEKIEPALASVYVSEGNELYKAGAEILGEANKKVNAGTLKTDDPAYTAQVEKAQVEFKKAIEILEKAKALDASNKNVQTLLDACKAVL